MIEPLLLGLVEQARLNPTECAIRDGAGTAISWADCERSILGLASQIHERELGPTRRVLVVARNRPSTVIAHAATVLAAACSVPVSFHLTASELAFIVSESQARVAFVDSTTEAVMVEAVSKSGSDVEIIVLPDKGAVEAASSSWQLRSNQRVLPNLLFTSGTTGRPKAVQLPPKTVGPSSTLDGFAEHISSHRLARHGTHLVVGPLYHNGPLTAVRLLLAGIPIIVMERFGALEMLQTIETYHVATSIMVPTHFSRALALSDNERSAYDTSSLTQVVHTGGRCPIEVKRAMIDWWGPILAESYGGTESGSVCSINSTDWLAHPGSVGRPVPPFEAIVVDENDIALPRDTEGRLYFRDTTGRGIIYEGDPQKTEEAHISPGVFTLGEVGYIDKDGFVFITDRVSDMVVSGGVNIYPAEAEQTLILHDSVADAVCIGLPDDEMGERLVALVEVERGMELDHSGLNAWCRSSLASYKCPKEYRIISSIPRNPMGKVDKNALRSAQA